MTDRTMVSVEEYLRTPYEPSCEYVDGLLVPKALGTRRHGKLQGRIALLIEAAFPHYEAIPELTVRISRTKYLIPDVAVDRRDRAQDPHALLPVHLCIEIVSPDDRLPEVLAKCETYHAWGTPHTWVIDPQTRRAWQHSKGSSALEIDAATGELAAGDIRIRLSEIFAVL
jgi:Uma2 family endonuclease